MGFNRSQYEHAKCSVHDDDLRYQLKVIISEGSTLSLTQKSQKPFETLQYTC